MRIGQSTPRHPTLPVQSKHERRTTTTKSAIQVFAGDNVIRRRCSRGQSFRMALRSVGYQLQLAPPGLFVPRGEIEVVAAREGSMRSDLG